MVAHASDGRWHRVEAAIAGGFPAALTNTGSGRGVLHHAALRGHLPTTLLALAAGACPNARDVHGWTEVVIGQSRH